MLAYGGKGFGGRHIAEGFDLHVCDLLSPVLRAEGAALMSGVHAFIEEMLESSLALSLPLRTQQMLAALTRP